MSEKKFAFDGTKKIGNTPYTLQDIARFTDSPVNDLYCQSEAYSKESYMDSARLSSLNLMSAPLETVRFICAVQMKWDVSFSGEEEFIRLLHKGYNIDNPGLEKYRNRTAELVVEVASA